MWKRYRLSISTLVIQLIACLHLVLSFWANSDLTKSPEQLSVDERISYNGVHSILKPPTPGEFVHSVVVGQPNTYGRIFFGLSAVCSAIPTLLLGDRGQILATRTTFSFVLVAAYLILVFVFLQRSLLRILCFAVLTFLPTTFYLSTLPHPEALSLLFTAIFIALFFQFKRRYRFIWTFLGLALGTDTGTLPLIVLFLALDLYGVNQNQKNSKFFAETAGKIGFFLFGASLATPVVLPNLFLGELYSQPWPHPLEPVLLSDVTSSLFLSPRAMAAMIYLLGSLPILFFIYRSLGSRKESHRNFIANESVQLLLAAFCLCFYHLYFGSNDSLVSTHLSLVLFLIGIFQFIQKRQLRWILIPGLVLLLIFEFTWSVRRYRIYAGRSSMTPLTRMFFAL